MVICLNVTIDSKQKWRLSPDAMEQAFIQDFKSGGAAGEVGEPAARISAEAHDLGADLVRVSLPVGRALLPTQNFLIFTLN